MVRNKGATAWPTMAIESQIQEEPTMKKTKEIKGQWLPKQRVASSNLVARSTIVRQRVCRKCSTLALVIDMPQQCL